MKKLEEYVRCIPDFPEEGVMFRDVTSVLQDADGLHLAIDTMQELVKDLDFEIVVGPESRGFILGMPLAYNLHKPFIPIRKKGKLPCETIEKTPLCCRRSSLNRFTEAMKLTDGRRVC